LEKWNRYRTAGAWPDADMLPLGLLGERQTRFTRDEQITLMTLWSIARSPLIHGGDMTRPDEDTMSLLTNDEVLAVDQQSAGNRPLFRRDDLIAWTADVPGSQDKYLALFNARDPIRVVPPDARYRSSRVTRDPATAARVDVNLAGARTLVLYVDPLEDGAGDHALWVDPTLVFSDGRSERLTNLTWSHADALWDNVSTERAPGGKAMMFRGQPVASGIGTLSASRIEYTLPPGAARFTAIGTIDDNAPRQPAGAGVQFVVAAGGDRATGPVKVSAKLSEVGFSGKVRVRDLWTHQDVGEFNGEFAPEIPFHGAGLYRLSPIR
jgi:alpha-galactosidase